MVERTVVLIKPDGMTMGAAEDIIERYMERGFALIHEKNLRFTEEQVHEFYKEHEGKPYFPELLTAMQAGLTKALLLEREDAVTIIREMHGATNPDKANPGTIRHDFKSRGGPYNTVHGSDSVEASQREAAIIQF